MTTTYENLGETGTYEIIVRVVKCKRAAQKNRAHELTVADVNGTEFEFVVWEKSHRGKEYEWQEECWYLLSGVTANTWSHGTVMHGASRLRIERLGMQNPGQKKAEILYLTDSHLGKTTHKYGGRSWSVSPNKGFSDAIDYAVKRGVDAVIHGGDLFHNSKIGISEQESDLCYRKLSKLSAQGIPFYFIYGNHEREEGQNQMQSFVDNDLATHLTSRPINVGGALAIYGIDYQREWTGFRLESPLAGVVTMLCVHQSVAPFSKANNPDCSLGEVLSSLNISLDLVVTGHVHTRTQHSVGDHQGLSGGSTSHLGETPNGLKPSIEIISANGTQATVEQHYI